MVSSCSHAVPATPQFEKSTPHPCGPDVSRWRSHAPNAALSFFIHPLSFMVSNSSFDDPWLAESLAGLMCFCRWLSHRGALVRVDARKTPRGGTERDGLALGRAPAHVQRVGGARSGRCRNVTITRICCGRRIECAVAPFSPRLQIGVGLIEPRIRPGSPKIARASRLLAVARRQRPCRLRPIRVRMPSASWRCRAMPAILAPSKASEVGS